MKKLLPILFIVFYSLSALADNTVVVNTALNNKITLLRNELTALHAKLDSVNIVYAYQLDSLNAVIHTKIQSTRDEFRSNCTDYYDRLDNEMDRTMTKFTWIWAVLGIIMPLIINYSNNHYIQKQIDEQYQRINDQINHQNSEYERRFEEHKSYIDQINKDIENKERSSRINSLISEAIQEKDEIVATSLYSNILELDPTNETALYNRGLIYKRNQNYKEALADLLKCINNHPRCIRAYNTLGNIYSKTKLYDTSLQYFQKGLEIDPQFSIIYYNIAILYNRQDNIDEAIKSLSIAIKHNKEYLRAYKFRHKLYSRKYNNCTPEEKEKYKQLLDEDGAKIRELENQNREQ